MINKNTAIFPHCQEYQPNQLIFSGNSLRYITEYYDNLMMFQTSLILIQYNQCNLFMP